MGVRAICPECESPMELPALTIPVTGKTVFGTLESQRAPGGALFEQKRYSLVVLSGENRGQVLRIEKPHVIIGRTECDINLEDSEISRQHALIKVLGTSALLEDLGSTNGTFVGGKRIQKADLEDRSEFRVGGVELMFMVTDRELDIPVE